jgi:hypothetical protein
MISYKYIKAGWKIDSNLKSLSYYSAYAERGSVRVQEKKNGWPATSTA